MRSKTNSLSSWNTEMERKVEESTSSPKNSMSKARRSSKMKRKRSRKDRKKENKKSREC
jgi:hypothetical protein